MFPSEPELVRVMSYARIDNENSAMQNLHVRSEPLDERIEIHDDKTQRDVLVGFKFVEANTCVFLDCLSIREGRESCLPGPLLPNLVIKDGQ